MLVLEGEEFLHSSEDVEGSSLLWLYFFVLRVTRAKIQIKFGNAHFDC